MTSWLLGQNERQSICRLPTDFVFCLISVKCIQWPKDEEPKKVAKFWENVENAMPKLRPKSQQHGGHRTDGPVSLNDISLQPSDSDKAYQEEVYDTINEDDIEARDKGYEKIKDTCMDNMSFEKTESTEEEVVQNLNSQNLQSSDLHAKQNEYINMLQVVDV